MPNTHIEVEKFLAGVRHVGVGIALTGFGGLFFGEMIWASVFAAALGVVTLAAGSLVSTSGGKHDQHD